MFQQTHPTEAHQQKGFGVDVLLFAQLLPRKNVLLSHTPNETCNVNPGLINRRLINKGCPLLVGIRTTFGGNTPLILGRVLLRSRVNIKANSR